MFQPFWLIMSFEISKTSASFTVIPGFKSLIAFESTSVINRYCKVAPVSEENSVPSELTKFTPPGGQSPD